MEENTTTTPQGATRPTDVRYRLGGFNHGKRDWAPVSVTYTDSAGIRMGVRFTITREALRMVGPPQLKRMAVTAAYTAMRAQDA